ncbi:MAG TPA: hypothetical protein VL500_06925 [Candidatus Eisenbacteria bacterium]|nr:hypothetical protein [Candidatus Eisenbacteria bacterium]
MKVIKKGSGAKGWSKRFKCTGSGNGGGGCGATLLVEHGDLLRTGSPTTTARPTTTRASSASSAAS